MPTAPREFGSAFAFKVARRFLAAILVAALIVLLIVAALYRQDLSHQREMLEQEARQVLTLQEELLLFELRAVHSDLLYLASQKAITHFLSGDADSRGDLEQEYANFAVSKGVYDQIRCLDTKGQEIVRVNFGGGLAAIVPPDELQSKASRYYYQQALSLDKGDVLVSPFDLNVEHGKIEQPIKPVIRFLTPVFDESGDKRGLLVLNYLGAHLLAKLKQISAGFRGQTMLVNVDGQFLQAPDPRHEWGWQLDHEYSFRKEFAAAWEQGRGMTSGQIRIGQSLFAVQRVSPGRRSASASSAVSATDPSSLILVAFISTTAANAHSRELLNQLLLLSVGVMLIVGLLSFYGARSGVIRRDHEKQIAESESRLRHLSSRLLAAQETERRNISRDLHDQLGQQVTAISLDLRSLEKKDGFGAAAPLLRRAIDETNELLQSLHTIATRVRPSVLDDLGLPDAVQSLLAEYQQRTGIALDTQLRFQREQIPATIGENVFRILQEALANVATHAKVDRATVSVETNDDWLRLSVRDSGTGFDPVNIKQSTRLGILGMRERVELLDGRFELQSAPGQGTQVAVSIPLRDDEP